MRLTSQSTRATVRTITLLAALTSLLLTMVTPFVGTAHAATLNPWPEAPYNDFSHDPTADVFTEDGSERNPTCADLDPDASGELKFDGNPRDFEGDTLTSSDGLLQVTLTDVYDEEFEGEDWLFFDFEVHPDSTRQVSSVFAKVSTTGAFFDYGPSPSSGDHHLHSAPGFIDDISHVSFCYNPSAAITIVKDLPNDDGGSAGPSDFELLLDGTEVVSGVPTTVTPGTHTVSEVVPSDLEGKYEPLGIDCGSFGSTDGTSLEITVEDGDSVECTITNDDVPGSLTLLKDVVNDDGGSAVFSDFTPTVSPSVGGIAFQDVGGADPTATEVDAGTYTLGEQLVDGYELTEIDCGDFGSTTEADTLDVTIGLDEHVTCTFVNDDEPGALELIKVINDPEDLYPEVSQDDFVPTVDGTDSDWGTQPLDAGSYTVGEHDAADSTLLADGTFVQSSTVCDGQETNEVAVANGQTSTCTITNTAVGAGLTVIKQVENDWGGQLGPSDFPLTVNGESVDSGASATFPVGDYAIAEEQQTGYELSDSFCTRDDEPVDGIDGESFDISVGAGETVICTFVNQDIPATVTLEKDVVNDDGGTLTQDDFPSFLDGDELDWDTTIDIAAGDHIASETPQDGYLAGDWGGDCAADGTFTAELDTDYVCTIVNDDIGSQLTLVKEIVNDDGGTATQDDFTPTHGYEPFVAPEDGPVAISATTEWGTRDVDAGIHTVGELLPVEGYELVDIVCQRNGDTFTSSTENDLEFEIGLDDEVTCTITNDDLPSTLNLSKEVINDDGGTATEDDFTPTVDYDGTGDASGVTDDPDWDSYTVPAGEYTIGELVVAGYLQEGVECDVEGETITGGETATFLLGNDQTADCVVTNNDIGPGLTVVKQVINDDGGTLGADDFPLEVTGSDEDTIVVDSGVSNDLDADTYTIGEQQQDGYELVDLSCVLVDGEEQVPVGELSEDGTTITVDLDLAQSIACTVVNDDIAPQVTLTKEVVNDDGGTLEADDFPVTFDGEDATWGEQFTTTVGDHQAAEEAQPGYLAGDWGGDCAADGSLTAEPGGVYECTITNDDVPAGLTIVKEVVNDDNGTLEPEDFPLEITPAEGETQVVDTGAVTTVDAGTYTIGEQQQDGYTLVSIVCDNGVEAAEGEETVDVTVANGESVICTITNDDPEPTIAATLLGPTCDNDTPYLVYELETEHVDSTEVTIHWFDADGAEQHTDVVDGLSGRVLWPGAEVDADDNPTDWPGWLQEADGTWVEGDDGFVWAREGAQVTLEVNPTTDPVTVEYPPPTPTCDASPPETEVGGVVFEQPEPEVEAETLPRTGVATGRLALLSGLIAALGMTLLLATRQAPTGARRRR